MTDPDYGSERRAAVHEVMFRLGDIHRPNRAVAILVAGLVPCTDCVDCGGYALNTSCGFMAHDLFPDDAIATAMFEQAMRLQAHGRGND